MTIPSVSTSNGYIANAMESKQISEDSTEKHQKFIENFVVSFLHPYITGQITRDTEPQNRSSLVDALLEKMPNFELAKREQIIEVAFQAYLKASALGLYVNCKMHQGIITPTSSKFEILVQALEKSVPKDFAEKKISYKQLEILAVEALIKVNNEKLQHEEEIRNTKSEISHGQLLKINFLNRSGKLFLDSNRPSTQQKIQIKKIEQELVSLLEAPTLECKKSIERQLTQMNSLNNIDNEDSFTIWKTLFDVINTLIQLKSIKYRYRYRMHDVDVLQNDLKNRYKCYLAQGRTDPSFPIFIDNVLNIFKLIEKINEIKKQLKVYYTSNGLIDLYIETLEEMHWNSVVYASPYENQETLRGLIQNNMNHYNLLMEVCQLIRQHSESLNNDKIKETIIELMENCIFDKNVSNKKVEENFLSLFSS